MLLLTTKCIKGTQFVLLEGHFLSSLYVVIVDNMEVKFDIDNHKFYLLGVLVLVILINARTQINVKESGLLPF